MRRGEVAIDQVAATIDVSTRLRGGRPRPAADRADLPIASLAVLGSPVDVRKVPLVAPVRPLLNLTQGRGAITRAYRALGGIPQPLVNWAFTAASAT